MESVAVGGMERNMASQTVKVGFIGLGHNGLAHIQAHVELGRSEVVALCDRNPHRLAEAGRRFGVEAQYLDDGFFSHPGLEAVSIHTGDPFHRDPFLKAMQAGKHILIEKPLANTEEDVKDMVAAAAAADPALRVQVGYILRFNPVYAAIHSLARAGRLGEIYYLEGDYVHNLLYQADQTDPISGRNWYLEEELPMVGGGSHALDLLRWISGKEVVQIAAYQNHFAFPQMCHDDCQVALFRFADGTVAKVAAIYAPRLGMAPFNNLRVYGTRGTVERDQVAISASDSDVEPRLSPVEAERVRGHDFHPEIADWLDAIVTGRRTRTPLCDAANSTIATLCAVRAAREGRPIEVPVFTSR